VLVDAPEDRRHELRVSPIVEAGQLKTKQRLRDVPTPWAR